jgi:hypothetical protein
MVWDSMFNTVVYQKIRNPKTVSLHSHSIILLIYSMTFLAVGFPSLPTAIWRRGSFVVPTQIIDHTNVGIHPASFFKGTVIIAHAVLGDPSRRKLVMWLKGRVWSFCFARHNCLRYRLID